MVATTENDTNRERVLKLIEEKESIERKINEYGEILKKNNVGFDELLVDSEGFPRNDIDVRSVRLARTQIICLQNDLKKMMSQIENGLGKYFNDVKDLPGPSSKLPPDMNKLSLVDEKPFLIVTLVDSNSPGDVAGIQVHDKIIKFGNFSIKNFINLAQIGELVKNSENKNIKLIIQRNDTELELIIVPKTWSGPGLLGFKINALPRE